MTLLQAFWSMRTKFSFENYSAMGLNASGIVRSLFIAILHAPVRLIIAVFGFNPLSPGDICCNELVQQEFEEWFGICSSQSCHFGPMLNYCQMDLWKRIAVNFDLFFFQQNLIVNPLMKDSL